MAATFLGPTCGPQLRRTLETVRRTLCMARVSYGDPRVRIALRGAPPFRSAVSGDTGLQCGGVREAVQDGPRVDAEFGFGSMGHGLVPRVSGQFGEAPPGFSPIADVEAFYVEASHDGHGSMKQPPREGIVASSGRAHGASRPRSCRRPSRSAGCRADRPTQHRHPRLLPCTGRAERGDATRCRGWIGRARRKLGVRLWRTPRSDRDHHRARAP